MQGLAVGAEIIRELCWVPFVELGSRDQRSPACTEHRSELRGGQLPEGIGGFRDKGPGRGLNVPVDDVVEREFWVRLSSTVHGA